MLLLVGGVAADTIVLTNGRVIEADRAWYEGTQLRYEKDGGVYGLPRSLVKELIRYLIDNMYLDFQGDISLETVRGYLREDDSRVRMGNAAENLSRLRRITLNLLKLEQSNKRSIRAKRLLAAWDHDYLLKLLGA